MKHRHYWEVDSENKGRCRDCPAVKDFKPLLKKKEKVSYGFIASPEITMAEIPGYTKSPYQTVREW